MRYHRALALLSIAALARCQCVPPSEGDLDAGSDASMRFDASFDVAQDDRAAPDTALPDSASPDNGVPDSSSPDTSTPDSGQLDSTSRDILDPDSSQADTAVAGDAQQSDGALVDAQGRDAIPVDGSGDASGDGGASPDGGAVDSSHEDAASPDATPVDLDPAPGVDTPGEHRCAEGPDSDTMVFTVALGEVTSHNFTGVVTDADGDGSYFVEGRNGGQLAGVIPTDPGTGGYSFTTPLFCGEQIVKLVWSNAECEVVVVLQVTTTGCSDTDLRVTVFWDALGDDWELHLIKPGGVINHSVTDCTWTTCLSVGPDWGEIGNTEDNPLKDVDNTGAYGPENIYLNSPEEGLFTVMVEHWGAGSAESDGYVIINIRGQLPVRVDIQNLAPQHVWTAATIEWPTKVVTPRYDIYDCNESWASGCLADLP